MARRVLREFHDFGVFARLHGEYRPPGRERLKRILFATLLGLWMPVLGIWAYLSRGSEGLILLVIGLVSIPLAALLLTGAFRTIRFTGRDIVVATYGRPGKSLRIGSLSRACVAEERGLRFLVVGGGETEIVIPLYDDLEAAIDSAIQGMHSTVE